MSAKTRRLLSTKEAADYVGVSPRTLERWVKEAQPRVAFYFDGMYRFSVADLDAYLESIYVPAGRSAV